MGFPKMSRFWNQEKFVQTPPEEPLRYEAGHPSGKELVKEAQTGPTNEDLERWYRELNESIGHPGEKDRIEDVRDEIYRYLR